LELLMTVSVWAGTGTITGGDCTCAVTKLSGGWCGACKFGHIAGFKITSEQLFEALDAHGHDIDPNRILCPSCKKALDSDGYCEPCRMGFVGKKAYLSRLTYALARGRPHDLSQLSCATCKKNGQRFGWCETCKVGMLGNVAISERKEFERGTNEIELLLSAVEKLEKCESCAVALFAGGRCLTCMIAYHAGQPIDKKNP